MTNYEKRALRYTANALSVARIIAAPYISHKIKTTPPEERSWKFGVFTAVVCATDKWDGLLGRLAGSTTNGSRLDKKADKYFSTEIYKALAQTGELSAFHWKSKVIRDVAITTMRHTVESMGMEAPASLASRVKTGLEYAAITEASSPLAATPGLVRSTAAAGTVLNLVTGVQLGVGFYSQLKQQDQPNVYQAS